MSARSLLSSILVTLLLLGCGSDGKAPSPTTVTDDLGRTVKIERPVDRVVSLAPNLTELVYAAGAGSTLVAVTTADDYPPAVDTVDQISALPVDFEALTTHEPDLVLATDQVNPPGDSETFEALDIPIYFFSFSTLEDVFRALGTTGRLLGTEDAALDSLTRLRQRADALRRRTADLSRQDRPRVLVLIGDDTLYSFGAGSYIHTLVDMAGGHSITDSLETEAPTLTDEFVLTEKPDVIVGAWGANYDPDRLLKLHPTWDIVPAVRNDRVHSLPPGLLLRPGPRLVDGAWEMARRLHPDRIEGDAGAPSASAHPAATDPLAP